MSLSFWAAPGAEVSLSDVVVLFFIWPAVVLFKLAGTHNIGTAQEPFYELTPIHLFAMLLGVVLSVLFWGWIVARYRGRPANRAGAVPETRQ